MIGSDVIALVGNVIRAWIFWSFKFFPVLILNMVSTESCNLCNKKTLGSSVG